MVVFEIAFIFAYVIEKQKLLTNKNFKEMKTIEQINTEIAKLNREAENYSIIAKYCGTKIAKELKKNTFFR